jgi:hypothetical protein
VEQPEQTYYSEAELRDFDVFIDACQQIRSYEAYLADLPDEALIEKMNQGVDPECRTPAWLDYGEYARAKYWSLDEAIALSLNTAPDELNWSKLQSRPDCSPRAYQYRNRRELFLRAVLSGELSDPISPGILALWATRIGLHTGTVA